MIMLQQHLPFTVLKLTVYYWQFFTLLLQQPLPFTVCAAECEAAEERSDDEAHTLQVLEQSEGNKVRSLLLTIQQI